MFAEVNQVIYATWPKKCRHLNNATLPAFYTQIHPDDTGSYCFEDLNRVYVG